MGREMKKLQEPFVVYWSGSSSQGVDDGEVSDEDKEGGQESNAQNKIADKDLNPDSYNEIKETVNVIRSLIQRKKSDILAVQRQQQQPPTQQPLVRQQLQ